MAGSSVVRKWLVAPDSRMAHRFDGGGIGCYCSEEDGGGECIIMGGVQTTSGIK